MVVGEAVSGDELPVIDLWEERSEVSKQIVKACEEFGFFKVINHGVEEQVVSRMEDECTHFFSKPAPQKQRAAGLYGFKNIGSNGDSGEVEYILLLHANKPVAISQASKSISPNHPVRFTSAVNGYVEAVKELACEILQLIAEGLGLPDTSIFSSLIRDVHSDSLLRLNCYPPLSSFHHNNTKIGIGEHTDPQILTLLKGNNVPGLQISVEEGVWLPVSPQPHSAFFINVGDALQAMTNGRFLSVKHRAMVHCTSTCRRTRKRRRMTMAYFAAPAGDAWITCPPQLAVNTSYVYRPFAWSDYMKFTYSTKLSDHRLGFFTAAAAPPPPP